MTKPKILNTSILSGEEQSQTKDTHKKNPDDTIYESSKQIIELKGIIQEKENRIHNLEATIAENSLKLNEIHCSTTWQIITKYQRVVDIIMPPATKRRKLHDLSIVSVRIIVNDGFGAFFYKLKEKVQGGILYASKIPIIEIKMLPPNVPLPLVKKLSGKFTFPLDNLNEIRILTATYKRLNSDLKFYITDSDGKLLREIQVKKYSIQDNGFTSFKFKPIKDSKERIFFFNLMSRGEPSAAVWYNESNTLAELQLSYDDKPLKGFISFLAFADIEIKNRYDIWMLKHETTAAMLEQYKKEIINFEYQPKISIITPVYNPDVAWIKAAIESVVNQAYGNWELCIADASTKKDVRKYLETFVNKDARIKIKFLQENMGISGNSNEALSLATGEYIGLLDHDDELSPDALYEAVRYLQNNRESDMIYSDEDKIDLKGNRNDPFFKPDWSPDKFLSHMYTCHFGVYKKKIIDEIGGFREGYDGSQDYDLVLRFIEKTNQIHHIPKILYHWRIVPGSTAGSNDAKKYAFTAAKRALNDYLVRNNIRGEVIDGLGTGSYHVKRDLLENPLISIIIPTKDNIKVLKKCIDSILKNTSYSHFEIIIVNNNSADEDTYAYFEELKLTCNIKILDYNKNFNFAAINNFAVKFANGKIILFLNNDTEVISKEWLSAMLEQVQRKEVGAVGCKLLYPDKTLQHAGVILGINYIGEHLPIAEHSPKYIPQNNQGYFGTVGVIHNLSAITAACMMLRKEVFEEVGGFDENLAVAYNDVDLCLKIRENGYLIVYTPYSELYHHESQSRGYDDTLEKRERFLKEIEYIRKKWGSVIDKGDPYYNPNLALDRVDFSIRI
jgi:GT2 family glycosyltransferase